MTRWAPLTGVVFVALWVAAFVLLAGGPESPGDAEIVAHYADEANRGQDVTAFFLDVAATLVFIGFLTILYSRLSQAQSGASSLTTLAFGAGITAAALWLVAGIFWMAISYTASETEEFRVDPDTERLVSEMAYLFFVTGMYASILVVFGASLLALRTGALPNWLGWLGLLVAVSLLGALGVFPFFIFLGWVLLVSIVCIVRPQDGAAAGVRDAGAEVRSA
ncbi:MAG TPA: DUF4386 family protein [Gaiellaceae bacterium]|nr:DUF4386 family protein [Gaiellaceae bacterium]